jgi:hypothetical protein
MYNNVGSVIKFQKRDASLIYRVSFGITSDVNKGLTDITA